MSVSELARIDELGVRHGTELSSLGFDLLRRWEPFLAPLRDETFDVLEIGAGNGASLRVWREWFPRARLVGLDVRRVRIDPPIANCTIVHGSQTDRAVLRELLREYRFRLVVDDGSVSASDKAQTFLTLFPWLEPDSAYVCARIGGVVVVPEPSAEQPFHERRDNSPASEERASPILAESGLPPAGQDWAGRQVTAAANHGGIAWAAWFAGLGVEIATGQAREQVDLTRLSIDSVLERATGVTLLRDSVVVTG